MIIENSGYTCISKTSDNSLLLLIEFGQCNEIRNAKLKMMDQTGLVPLQSCFSCTRVRDDSTLHSSITAIFVGTSRLIPPGERLSRHCSPRPCPEAGANTPLQITLQYQITSFETPGLCSSPCSWGHCEESTTAFILHLHQRTAFLSCTDCDNRIIRGMPCTQAISKEQSLGK